MSVLPVLKFRALDGITSTYSMSGFYYYYINYVLLLLLLFLFLLYLAYITF